MKICILGFGTMGEMYARLIAKESDTTCELWIANRTASRMESFKNENRKITITNDFRAATANSDIVFLCVTPQASYEVLRSVKEEIAGNALLVSFVSDVSIKNIEKCFNGKIIHLVPTITSYVGRGITLISKNDKVTESDIDLLLSYVDSNIRYKIVDDHDINGYSMISSCGPGIVSALLNELASSYARNANLELKMVSNIVNETVSAACAYSESTGKNYTQILREVATKGGITESGASVITEECGKTFDEMIQKMKAKHAQRTESINALYS